MTCLSCFSNLRLTFCMLFLFQAPSPCEGGASWDGGGQQTHVPYGICHSKPEHARWWARHGGGASHRGAGVGGRLDGGGAHWPCPSLPPSYSRCSRSSEKQRLKINYNFKNQNRVRPHQFTMQPPPLNFCVLRQYPLKGPLSSCALCPPVFWNMVW